MSEIERGNPTIGDGNIYRFYKSNLPAGVWDPTRNCALAEFKQGVFETRDIKVAEKIQEFGYPQVNPLADAPPDVILTLPGHSIDTTANSVENIKPGMRENTNAKPLTPVAIKGV